METLIEAARRWVDWASGSMSAQKWEDAAYNLDRFDEVYNAADDSDELEALNARAEYLRSLLEERNMQTATAGIFAPFTPDANRKKIELAAAASVAAAQASKASADAAGAGLIGRQSSIQIKEVPKEKAYEIANAPNAFGDFFGQSFLGVPLWAWGAGAIGLFLLTKGRK